MIALYYPGKSISLRINAASERGFMRTARENVSIFRMRSVLKRLLDEYEAFDTASRLCADYCVNANDIALIIDKAPKHERRKSRLTFAIRSDETIDKAYLDEVYLMAQ
jgi:hypothetical protein